MRECSASCRQGKWWGGGSVSDVDCVGVECTCGGAVMAQWWEHSPPTNVDRVQFQDSAPYVGWVCCWFSSLLRDVFLRVLRFSPLLKNQHFQIAIRSGLLSSTLSWASGSDDLGKHSPCYLHEINCFKVPNRRYLVFRQLRIAVPLTLIKLVRYSTLFCSSPFFQGPEPGYHFIRCARFLLEEI